MKKGEFLGQEIECFNCGNKKYYKPFKIKNQKYFFCNRGCQTEYMKKIGYPNAIKEEKHHNWKGEKVGYGGVHLFLKKKYPKPKKCEECNQTRKVDLSNISGKYLRNIKDFKWLCRSCHQKYDRTKMEVEYEEIESIDCVKSNELFYDIGTETSNFVANGLITHNCKPHKRSICVGEYMPYQTKEMIELAVCVDLSGSIGADEYTDFLSEIIGIARAFQERITIHFYSHDTDGYYCGLVRNGNIEQIKKIQLKGGGGTDFDKPSKFIKEKTPKIKSVIWLTDGYGTELSEKMPYDILWVLDKNGSDEIIKKYGKVIKLDKSKK